MNFYKHHLGDYDGDTLHLSWDEDLAYTRLLRAYYRREKPISEDEKYRLTKATTRAQRAAVDSVLAEFFTLSTDGYHNKRADEEIHKYQAQASTNRRIAGERTVKRTVNDSKQDRIPSQKPEASSQNQNQKPEEGGGPEIPVAVAIAVALRAAGIQGANSTNPIVQQWATEGVTVEQAKEAARIAIEDRGKPSPGVKYLVGIVADLRAAPPASSRGNGTHREPEPTTCDEMVNGERCTGPRVYGRGEKWYCREHFPH